MKWYNPGKRYGFVELSDGSGDAFLHASAVAGISIGALQPGVTIEFRTALAQRGLQVTEVISVDSSTAAPPRPPRKSVRSPLDRQPLEASVQEMGTVKWYNAAKGFGFIVLDSGGKDVFVHASVLDRAGITGLNEGQRVSVGVAEGQKGPEAASIEVATSENSMQKHPTVYLLDVRERNALLARDAPPFAQYLEQVGEKNKETSPRLTRRP